MSSIPKPKTVRKPKTLGTDAELDTLEHQHLLDWLWTNLDRLIPLWICTKQEVVEDHSRKAIEAYKDRVEETLRAYHRCAEIADDQEHVPALKRAIKRVEKHLLDVRASLPPLPDDSNVTTVSSKHYQNEITVRKYDRSGDGRNEIVGYIDVEANLSMFNSCRLEGCPAEKIDIFTERFRKPSAEEFSKQRIRPVEWEVSRSSRRVWFDVRATLPTTGALIRELKVLQELAGEDVIVALVADDLSEQLRALLRHEGFWSLSKSDMSQMLDDQLSISPPRSKRRRR